jgi:SAM-dependent methyltransferase
MIKSRDGCGCGCNDAAGSDEEAVRSSVRRAYGKVARGESSCCGGPSTAGEVDMGLSCGDPLEYAGLTPGDKVLDLGCGGGRDLFPAAEDVGPEGRVVGVDMTPEMVDLALQNAERLRKATGLCNVEVRPGDLEDLPLEDGSMDVVISNCVINLAPDKEAAFREAARVLRPEGRMVVSDIVLNRPLPPGAAEDPDLYSACVAGALLREEYLAAIGAAGFEEVRVLADTSWDAASCCGHTGQKSRESLAGCASSITVLATWRSASSA